MNFPTNPINGQKYTENYITYIFDGIGWVKESKFFETDPVYQKEKKDIVFLDTFNSEKEIILQEVSKKQPQPQFKIRRKYSECAFKNDLIELIRGDGKTVGRDEVLARYCIVQNSNGIQTIDPILIYSEDNTVYLSDKQGIISRNSNFEWFELHYDIILNNFKDLNYDIQGSLGRNTLNEESGTDHLWHADMILKTFNSVYPNNPNWIKSTFEFPELNNSDLSQIKTPSFCVKNKINLILKPYVGGATDEQVSSNPDILTIGSHYSNGNTRRDITSSSSDFLSNVIAVSAGLKLADTSKWTTYGFGVEFCETYDKAEVDARYPAKNVYMEFAKLFTANAECTILKSTDNANFINYHPMEIGQLIYIAYPTGTVSIKVAEVIDNSTIRVETAVPAFTNEQSIYGWLYGTLGEIAAYQPAQSPTCAIVGAKFRKIQDLTNANWQLIREACRMTASNSTMTVVSGKKVYTPHWDMYRGFGIIDVDKAVEWIKQNYSENQEYLESVVAVMPKVNPMIGYKDLQSENYVPKSIVENLMKLIMGGRNLVRGNLYFGNTDYPAVTKIYNSENKIVATGSWDAFRFIKLTNEDRLGKQYTSSIYVMSENDNIIKFQTTADYPTGLNTKSYSLKANKWRRIDITSDVINEITCTDPDSYFMISLLGDNPITLHFKSEFKVEEGISATRQTPAPEDLGFNI